MYLVPWLQTVVALNPEQGKAFLLVSFLFGEHASVTVALALMEASVCGGDSKPAEWRAVCYFREVMSMLREKSIGRDLGNVRSDFCCTLTNDMTTAFSKLHFLNRLARQAVLGHSKDCTCGLVDTEHFMGAQSPMTREDCSVDI